MKMKLKALKESIGKTASTAAILCTLISVGSNGGAVAIAGEKNLNLKELRSQSVQGYYTIKYNLVKQIVDQMDFTNINLDKSYSLTRTGQGPLVVYDDSVEDKIKCSLMWDTDLHVIFKSGRAIVISRYYNSKFIFNNNCNEEELSDSLTIESYLVPQKSEFKSVLLNAQWTYQQALIKSGQGKGLNKEAVFTLDDTGYTVQKYDGSIFSKHTGKAINPNMIFLEEEQNTVLYNDLNFGDLNMDSKINSYLISSSVFIGNESQYILWTNPGLFRNQDLGDKTIGQFLKDLAL